MMTLLPHLPDLLHGLLMTLTLMFASASVGLILALLLTLAITSNVCLLKKPAEMVIFFVRGTPLLVQLFLIYYGIGQFAIIRESVLWIFFREPMACAIITLSLNTACYTAILLTGAIKSVPKSELAACEALGMSHWQALRYIIFPRAFRLALPAYSNEVIIVLKCTSLASTITILDLMGVTQQLINQTYNTATWYLFAGLIYLLLNAFIMASFKFFEHRMRIPT